MKTQQWIDVLATQPAPVAAGTVARRMLAGSAAGFAGALLLMLALLGVRHDFADAVASSMFWGKLAFAAALAVTSALLAVHSGRPGRALGRDVTVLAVPVALLWLLAAGILAAAPAGARVALVMGDTWRACPWLIALLAAPVFAATIWVLRGLAPTRLRAAGAAAGLFAGALATLVYALHCPESAAPFVAVWYVAGIAIPAAAGALLGPRLLRW